MTREEFDLLIEEIDAKLQSEGVEVRSRPFMALSEASVRLNKQLNLVPPKVLENTKDYSGEAFSWHVHQWYDRRYNSKLSIGSLGTIAINLRGEFWKGVLPHIFGSITVFIHRIKLSTNESCNILDCIENLPPDLRYQLSDMELRGIGEIANLAFDTYLSLDRLHKYELAEAAKSDLLLCVSNLDSVPNHL